MKHAQNSNGIFGQLIGYDIWCPDDDELSGRRKPAGPAALGKVLKAADRGGNPLIHRDCRHGIVGLYMREYPVAIRKRQN